MSPHGSAMKNLRCFVEDLQQRYRHPEVVFSGVKKPGGPQWEQRENVGPSWRANFDVALVRASGTFFGSFGTSSHADFFGPSSSLKKVNGKRLGFPRARFCGFFWRAGSFV